MNKKGKNIKIYSHDEESDNYSHRSNGHLKEKLLNKNSDDELLETSGWEELDSSSTDSGLLSYVLRNFFRETCKFYYVTPLPLTSNQALTSNSK